jgi:1-acyl-sn-glycerol-3-phosphate acyltransferase
MEFYPTNDIVNLMKLRSLVFTILFYIATAFIAIIFLPTVLLPYRICQRAHYTWSWSMVKLLQYVVGITHHIEGERPDHQVIFAVKHESTWEAVFLYSEFNGPALVFKRELSWIPIFGFYTIRVPSVPIDRSAGLKSMKKLVENASKIKNMGENILIFPQGTRIAHGEQRPYHPGIYSIYKATGLPVVPVALNSGVFWPRHTMIKKPGVIDVRLLPEIPAGLDRKTFMARLEHEIESATDQLPKS